MVLFADGPIRVMFTGTVTEPRNPALSSPVKRR
jgi:hypothetical protein